MITSKPSWRDNAIFSRRQARARLSLYAGENCAYIFVCSVLYRVKLRHQQNVGLLSLYLKSERVGALSILHLERPPRVFVVLLAQHRQQSEERAAEHD